MFYQRDDDPTWQASVDPRSHFQDLNVLATHQHPQMRLDHLDRDYTWTLNRQDPATPVHMWDSDNNDETLLEICRLGDQQQYWTPKQTTDNYVDQSHNVLDPRSPHGVISLQTNGLLCPRLDEYKGPLQASPSSGYYSWNHACSPIGYPHRSQEVILSMAVPPGQEKPQVDLWMTDDNQKYAIAQTRTGECPKGEPWMGENSESRIKPNCKFTHAHNPDHRAFFFWTFTLCILCSCHPRQEL